VMGWIDAFLDTIATSIAAHGNLAVTA